MKRANKEPILGIAILLMVGIALLSGCISPSVEVQLPAEDVEGEDIPGVPRYRPSVRTHYEKGVYGDALFVDVTYYTEDGLDEVVKFYRDEMPKHNWQLLKEEAVSGISFYDFEVTQSREYDFRRPGCTDPEWCLPYAKITIGGFRAGRKDYTVIMIGYEDYAVSTPEATAVATPELGPVTPPSEFGQAFHEFMAAVLSAATGGQATLTSYNETPFGILTVNAVYTLASAVADLSLTAENIRQELIRQGVSAEVIAVSVTGTRAEIAVGGPTRIGGKEIGLLTVELEKNSKAVNISVMAAGP